MASVEDLILKSIDEIKEDLRGLKTEVKLISQEVIKLKTKAAVFGSIAGSVAALIVAVSKMFIH